MLKPGLSLSERLGLVLCAELRVGVWVRYRRYQAFFKIAWSGRSPLVDPFGI
jgi:hypothetical protein